MGAELTLILTLDVLEALDTKGVTWSWLDEAKKLDWLNSIVLY